MDDPTEIIKNFEGILKQNAKKKPVALYKDQKNKYFLSGHGSSHSIQDVISKVSIQIKAIHKADIKADTPKQDKQKLNKYKKSSFLPVNMLPRDVEVSVKTPATRFETQLVSDTQLIHIIDNAEALVDNNGITQEFDCTFSQTDIEKNANINKNYLVCKENKTVLENDTHSENIKYIQVHNIDISSSDVPFKENRNINLENKTDSMETPDNHNFNAQCKDNVFLSNDKDMIQEDKQLNDNCTEMLIKCIEIERNLNLIDDEEIEDEEIQPSMVFEAKKSKTPSPLVFDLETFENFAKIAAPIVEENSDFRTAKQLINSQIIGKELFIQTDLPCEVSQRKEQLSPVLKISAERLKITKTKNSNKSLKNHNNKEHIPVDVTESDGTFLKDEILFSSDEENEYLNKEFQDIPLTCALETSFYEQPDLLDKTMYVGFQTASNRSIQISTESFSKAKSVLEEVDKDLCSKVTLTDLVDSLSAKQNNSNFLNSSHSRRSSEKTAIVLKLEGTETANLVENKIDHLKRSDKRKLEGFMTASRKKIKLSEMALARCKKVFQDIDLDENYDTETDTEIKLFTSDNFNEDLNFHFRNENKVLTCINTKLETNTQIDDDILQEFANDMPLIGNQEIELEASKTASEEEIRIKDAHMATGKKFFDGIDFSDRILEGVANEKINSEKSPSHTKENIKDISLKTKFNYNLEFLSFKTASNNPVNISIKAYEKTINVFQDINICEYNETNLNTAEIKDLNPSSDFDTKKNNQHATGKGFGRFKTASNRDIKISNEALVKSKSILHDIITNVCEDRQVEGFDDDLNEVFNTELADIEKEHIPELCEFKTASNKPINISENALVHSKNVFKDIDVDDEFSICEKNMASVPETLKKSKTELNTIKTLRTDKTSIENKSFPSKSLSKANNAITNTNCAIVENLLEDLNIKPFMGFQTASRKPINISNEAIAKSKEMFGDIDDDNVETISIKDNKIKEFAKFEGFQTANKKAIKISAKALAQSKELFKNIDNDDILNIKAKIQDRIQKFKDCQITSTTPVQVYHALALSGNVLKDTVNDSDTSNMRNDLNKFVGFQTASKKPVKISDEALAKSKAIFKDINDQEHDIVNKNGNNNKDHIPTFKGFQTASKKAVKISPEALARSKALFQDIEKDFDSTKENIKTGKDNIPQFVGFQTASKKPVQISAEALTKSKVLFQDIDKDLKNAKEHSPRNLDSGIEFKGFETASKKPVHTTAETLAKSKALFKDIDQGDIIEKESLINKVDITKFMGFETANRKLVQISEEALAKSKALFKADGRLVNNVEKNSSSSKVIVPKFIGFETASKKPAQVSDEAYAKSKALFKEFDNEIPDLTNSSQFLGFQTGNNNSVKVSEEALAKAKRFFDDIDSFKENDAMDNKISQFKGFETASNKKVKMSEEALKKSRQVFQDIHFKDDCKDNLEDTNKDTYTYIRFKTGNNNNIKVSEHFLKDSRKLLTDLDNGKNITETPKTNTKMFFEENKVGKLIDTQVLNNFEQTLYTEDFIKESPKRSKRSGSPILSCPRAKKRKFNTPYRNDGKIPTIIARTTPKHDDIPIFNDDYKKNKRYTLKDLAKVEELNAKLNPDPYILNFNMDNLLDFEFTGQRNDITDGNLSINGLKECFFKVVNKKLIPNGWLEIQIKLILWKLISYEVKFPQTLDKVCTAKNVIEQLKYRYEKELYNVERPVLRKILEKDDTASKTMVLCVAGIFVDGVKVSSVTNITSNVELLLTDGWYCVKAVVDKMLTKLVYDEKITVGCKIVTNGAELLNCEQGVAPWEDISSVRLKIFGNSTRRARWDARLGCHGYAAILTKLSSVKPEGGKVSKMRLYVTRVFPMLYVEKFEDGSTVTRSERLENIHQIKYEADRQTAMEKLYEEVEKELSDQESQDSVASQQKNRKHYESMITESQTRYLEEKSDRKREKLLQNIQERVRKKIEEQGLNVGRNVVTLLKIRVAGVEKKSGIVVTKGFMSIWKPNDVLAEIIKEDSWIEVLNVVPTAIRYSEIHLSAGRQSIFNQCKYKEKDKIKPYLKTLVRKYFPVGDLSQNPTMTTDYNEVDTVGFIFQIDEESSKQPFQNIYLSDGAGSIICVNFWGGLKKFGFQNVLDTGQIVACTNLQKRAGNTRKSIPQFRVTEFTFFTKTPKNLVARNMIYEMEKRISGLDKKKYCEECIKLKNNYSNKYFTENVSPYRFNDVNLIKNKVFIDSPLVAKREDNLNLTGLDFESTFRQTDTQELSPKSKERKKKVNEKIAKLKMIGEPPPLCPINILNKSKNASNSYKSPLAQTGVAGAKKSTDISSKDIQSSPIIQMNRTYVKNIHPVKLNFSNAQENSLNEEVDHFAEEFDGSPPLSLE